LKQNTHPWKIKGGTKKREEKKRKKKKRRIDKEKS